MGKWIRYYNQNRKTIWTFILVIVVAFLMFTTLINTNKNENQISNSNINSNVNNLATNTTRVTTKKSVASGKTLETEELEEASKIIDEFISYCNNGEIQKAYELLTTNCQEQVFKDQETFEQTYCNKLFEGGGKTCNIENWQGDTYKVNIFDDSLSTGKSNNGFSKQDYITIEEQEGERKLNINSYIEHSKINSETKNEELNITMKVLSSETYMDYQIYKIKVKNNTENKIVLDTRIDPKTLYIRDENGAKSSAYSHELTDTIMEILPVQEKTIDIKFYMSYSENRKAKSIVFSDLNIYEDGISHQYEFEADI